MASKSGPVRIPGTPRSTSRRRSTSKIHPNTNNGRLWAREMEGAHKRSASMGRLRRIDSLSLQSSPAGAIGKGPRSQSQSPMVKIAPPVPPKPASTTRKPVRVSTGIFKRRRSQSTSSATVKTTTRKSRIPVSRYPPAVAAKIFLLQSKEQELSQALQSVRQQLAQLRGRHQPLNSRYREMSELSARDNTSAIHSPAYARPAGGPQRLFFSAVRTPRTPQRF